MKLPQLIENAKVAFTDSDTYTDPGSSTTEPNTLLTVAYNQVTRVDKSDLPGLLSEIIVLDDTVYGNLDQGCTTMKEQLQSVIAEWLHGYILKGHPEIAEADELRRN